MEKTQKDENDGEESPFLKAINSEDAVGVIIRGHLFVEAKLIDFIEACLRDPGAIELSRLSFPMKVSLATALGILDRGERQSFLMLNALRNRFAHSSMNPGDAISETDLKNLVNAFPTAVRDDFLRLATKWRLDSESTLERLRHVIAFLFHGLDVRLEKVRDAQAELASLKEQIDVRLRKKTVPESTLAVTQMGTKTGTAPTCDGQKSR